jgi:hypothetical protein
LIGSLIFRTTHALSGDRIATASQFQKLRSAILVEGNGWADTANDGTRLAAVFFASSALHRFGRSGSFDQSQVVETFGERNADGRLDASGELFGSPRSLRRHISQISFLCAAEVLREDRRR